jgi:hypothetical protein
MLTNWTSHIRTGSTTCSTSLCSTAIHLLPPDSRHLNCSRQSSTTLTNGKSTGSFTLSNATGSSIISYNGQVTVTYGLAGSLRRISGMRRNWLMSFTEGIRGSLEDDWTFYGCFTLLTSLWISAQYKWRRHGFLPPPETIRVEVQFPCAPNRQ